MASVNDIGIERFLDYINNERIQERIYLVEFLRQEDETPYLSITNDIENGSGSVTNSFNEGVRRTTSFTLNNETLKYNETIENLTISSKFRVSLGYMIDGIDVLIPQGVYFFDDPTFNGEYSLSTIGISGTDKWAGLNGASGGVFEATYLISAGSKVSDAVKGLLALDIVADPIEPIIDSRVKDLTLTYDITRNSGDTASDLILEMCGNISAYCYYNEKGQLVISPFEEDDAKGSIHDFNQDDINYMKSNRTQLNSEVYNAVQITADNIQANTSLWGEAINNRLDDKNSLPNIGKKKTKKITDYVNGIDTQEKLDIRLSWELQRWTFNDSTYSIACRPLYRFDVNQAVTLTEPKVNVENERCLMYSITYPFDNVGDMSITAKKAVASFG